MLAWARIKKSRLPLHKVPFPVHLISQANFLGKAQPAFQIQRSLQPSDKVPWNYQQPKEVGHMWEQHLIPQQELSQQALPRWNSSMTPESCLEAILQLSSLLGAAGRDRGWLFFQLRVARIGAWTSDRAGGCWKKQNPAADTKCRAGHEEAPDWIKKKLLCKL